jgi:hypothetical protein
MRDSHARYFPPRLRDAYSPVIAKASSIYATSLDDAHFTRRAHIYAGKLTASLSPADSITPPTRIWRYAMLLPLAARRLSSAREFPQSARTRVIMLQRPAAAALYVMRRLSMFTPPPPRAACFREPQSADAAPAFFAEPKTRRHEYAICVMVYSSQPPSADALPPMMSAGADISRQPLRCAERRASR